MSQTRPTIKKMSIAEVEQQFGQLIVEVAEGNSRIVIEKDGEPLVRIEPAKSAPEYQIDELMEDPGFRDLAAISEALKDRPLSEIEEQIALSLRAGRERRRKEREQASNIP